jgi:hypothetical protein
MRKSITGIVTAALIAASLIAQPKPAEARCWSCRAGAGGVIAGWSHAHTYGSIYGPYWAYPPYSEYGYAPYYVAPAYYYAPPLYAPPLNSPYFHAHHPYSHHYHPHYW